MKIALISDTHLMPAAPALDANLAAARDWIAAQGIGHTIHLGDISADGAVHPAQLDHAWQQLRDWPGSLHILPGNHDVGDNPGSGHRLADADRLARYAALFGADRWHLALDRWTLIGVNAQLYGQANAAEQAQDAWLAAILAEATGPIGLFVHKPLFRDGPADRSTHHRYIPPDAGAALLARFATHDLRFIASGHTHQSRALHIDGIEHVWIPSTAFVLPDAMQETIGVKEVGMMVLTLEDDGHFFERLRPAAMRNHDLADHAYLYPEHAAELKAIARASDI